jgi:pimeloyl-ACP methyl ester carboxylesterase
MFDFDDVPRSAETDFRRKSLGPETEAYASMRIRDMRFAYRRSGQGGVPVILLHGWPQASWTWRRVMPLLDPSCDVIVPDLPGFGSGVSATYNVCLSTVAAPELPVRDPPDPAIQNIAKTPDELCQLATGGRAVRC